MTDLAQVKDRIVSVHWPKGGNPWYWYIQYHQPLHFSVYGQTFYALPNWPMIKFLLADPRPFPGPPCPPVGFNSLPEAVLSKAADMADYNNGDVPGHAGGLYGMLLRGKYGLLGGGGGAIANTILGSPMTSPYKDHFTRVIGSITIAGRYPDIWTLCGLKRPPLRDPDLPWNFLTNPYYPTKEKAEICARTFESLWNASAAAVTKQLMAIHGFTPVADASGYHLPPVDENIGWGFAIPWQSTFVGLLYALNFNAGNNAAIHGFPLPGVIYPFPYEIRVAQLDPADWITNVFPPRKRPPPPV